MKKIIFTLFISLLLGCSDADVMIEPFNFDGIDISKCATKDILYKIKSSEILFITFPIAENLKNEETPANEPREIILNTINKVIYRVYSDAANSTVICNDIPPVSPFTQTEWNAKAGAKIQIVTTKKLHPNTNTIEYYKHVITFKNIEFSNGTESFVYDNYEFGEYRTNP